MFFGNPGAASCVPLLPGEEAACGGRPGWACCPGCCPEGTPAPGPGGQRGGSAVVDGAVKETRVAGAAAARILALKLSAALLRSPCRRREQAAPCLAPRSTGDGWKRLWPCLVSHCFPWPARSGRVAALEENGEMGWTVIRVERLRSCVYTAVTYIFCFAKVKHK